MPQAPEAGLLNKKLLYSCCFVSDQNCKISSCGRIGFLPNGQRHIGMKVIGTNLCANVNHWRHLFHPNLFRRSCNKMMHLAAGCVMKGSITFYQKIILEHSMGFHRGYIKRCLTQGQSEPNLLVW
jgi:hypothetical protein